MEAFVGGNIAMTVAMYGRFVDAVEIPASVSVSESTNQKDLHCPMMMWNRHMMEVIVMMMTIIVRIAMIGFFVVLKKMKKARLVAKNVLSTTPHKAGN